MIVQYNRTYKELKRSIYNQTIDGLILYNEMNGYRLKANRNQILDDYIASPKLLITTVVPIYDSPYDEEAIILGMSLGWKFKCCGRSFADVEQFEHDKNKTKWLSCWSWDNMWPMQIKDIIDSNKKNGTKTAFIGYRIDEAVDMNAADYSGTCIDAMEYTKGHCDFVSDRSFNNFAFGELLIEIINKDIKKFVKENFLKYFENLNP